MKLALRGARIACAGLVLLLAACGGGAGGGGGSSGPSMSVSTTSVTFVAVQNGATPASQQVGVSVTGTVFGGIDSTAGNFFSASFSITGQTTGVITVTPSAPTLAPGTYTGSITFRGCGDQFCNTGDVPGSPKVINVSYTIQAPVGLSPNPQSLTFNQLQGGGASPT